MGPMAMFFIKERAMISTKTFRAALMLGACMALSTCTQSSLRINPDFGYAVHQDAAAETFDVRRCGLQPRGLRLR